MRITIKHQEEKTYHTFKVVDANNLSAAEVMRICEIMGVIAIFVNGKYYEYKN
jgi:hypothetical protein